MDKYLTGIDVPGWVRWIAVDANGSVWGFSKEPEKCAIGSEWSNSKWDEEMGIGKCPVHLYKGKPPKDFTQELYRWGYE